MSFNVVPDLGKVGEEPQRHDRENVEGKGVGGRPGAGPVVVAVRVAHRAEPEVLGGEGVKLVYFGLLTTFKNDCNSFMVQNIVI